MMEQEYYVEPQTRNRLVRRVILVVAALVLLMISIPLVIQYFTIGQVVVSTNNPNAAITLTKGTETSPIKESHGKMSLSIHSGEYILHTEANSQGTSRTINVKAHKTTKIDLNIAPATGVQPVSDSDAQSIIAGTTKLYFVNALGNLTSIDTANNQTVLNTAVKLKYIRWASSSFGVGLGDNNTLYSVINGVLSPINPDVTPGRDDTINIAVAPNHSIYLAIEKTVYRGGADGKFQKIYTSDVDVSALIAGNDIVGVISNVDDDADSGDSKRVSSIALVQSSGKSSKKDVGTFMGALSTDGKYLAINSTEGGEVLDSSLHKVATVPSTNLNNLMWMDNHTLAYSSNDQVWKYDVNTQQATLIANTPLGETISELSLSDDASYLYMGVNHIDNSPVIKRIGLQNQVVSPVVYQLQSIMPLSSGDDGYFMTLTNFTSPLVTVGLTPPLANTDAAYLQLATDKLSQNGIDTSQIQIRLAQQ